MNRSKTAVLLALIPIVAIAAVLGTRAWLAPKTSEKALDAFASCLADKKITMYGAAWCSHCQNEKNAFGESFRLVPYVECPQNPEQCTDAGITGYPTWIFPNRPPPSPLRPPSDGSEARPENGRRLVGEQGLKTLSRESGCPIDAQ